MTKIILISLEFLKFGNYKTKKQIIKHMTSKYLHKKHLLACMPDVSTNMVST